MGGGVNGGLRQFAGAGGRRRVGRWLRARYTWGAPGISEAGGTSAGGQWCGVRVRGGGGAGGGARELAASRRMNEQRGYGEIVLRRCPL